MNTEENQAYLKHLGAVNQLNPVTAAEDVLNEDKALLLKRGSRISDQAIEKLLRFKLLKPIEESIGLENSLTGDFIYKKILSSLKRSNILESLYNTFDSGADLQKACQWVEQYPLLIQKLTVHSQQRPEEFEKTTICAWLSLYIGYEYGLTEDQLLSLFLAALCHDMGMLHIDPAITEKQGDLTAEEWRSVQCHVVIGEKIMRGVGLPESCGRAIMEHHERCDGSGYPNNIAGDKLSIEGQIIAMCDMVVAVILNRLNDSVRGSADLIAILHVNSEVHFYQIYKIVVRKLRNATKDDITPDLSHEDVNQRINTIKKMRGEIVNKINVISEVLQKLSSDMSHKKVNAISICKHQLEKVLSGSGIIFTDYVNWLDDNLICFDPSIIKEIEDSLVMLHETRWRLRHIERNLQLLLDHDTKVSAGSKQAIDEGLKLLAEL